MFKVGDRVRCVDNSREERRLTVGRTYTVSVDEVCGTVTLSDAEFAHYLSNRFVLADEPQPIMVPVDPACVPDGWEAVRIGHPQKGEHYVSCKNIFECDKNNDALLAVCLIVRKKYVASVSIPKGWLVYPVDCETWYASDTKPFACNGYWSVPLGSNTNKLWNLNFTPPEDGQPRQVT